MHMGESPALSSKTPAAPPQKPEKAFGAARECCNALGVFFASSVFLALVSNMMKPQSALKRTKEEHPTYDSSGTDDARSGEQTHAILPESRARMLAGELCTHLTPSNGIAAMGAFCKKMKETKDPRAMRVEADDLFSVARDGDTALRTTMESIAHFVILYPKHSPLIADQLRIHMGELSLTNPFRQMVVLIPTEFDQESIGNNRSAAFAFLQKLESAGLHSHAYLGNRSDTSQTALHTKKTTLRDDPPLTRAN